MRPKYVTMHGELERNKNGTEFILFLLDIKTS